MTTKVLETSFNPRLCVPNYQNYLNVSKSKAKKAQNYLEGFYDIKYGDTPLQNLDVYFNKSKTKLPIHIFIHGGYWRALDKSYHTHMALPFYNKNICFFNINYDLCPKVTLTEIRLQIIKAIVWIFKNAHIYNGDNSNIVLSGHSAGAHLASLMLDTNWESYGLNKQVIKGLALISGIYETKLVVKLEINKEIGLTNTEAENNNPFNIIPKTLIPTIISYGNDEPRLWIEQSKKYIKYLNDLDFKCSEIKCNNNNHFSLIDTLATSNHILVKKIINLSLKI